MREIKFRAWDKTGEYKTMASVLNLYSGTSPFVQCACDWQDGNIYRWRVFTRAIENVALMQFTGLKDKNGKEIWEGDILSNGFSKGVVKADRAEWSWGDYLLQNNPMRLESIEVIGNIYENPELLK